jgi:signal transduction histidine kinase
MSRVYGGIGLGLALVQKLTVLLGGELHVVSEVDVGSTFCVSLPLRLAARVTTPPATDTCETLAGTG